MLKRFEHWVKPTELPAETAPPAELAAFYWYFVRQTRGLFALLFCTGLFVAVLDTTIPLFIGRVVTLVSNHAPETLLRDAGPQLAGMAAVLLLGRPLAVLLQNLITAQ